MAAQTKPRVGLVVAAVAACMVGVGVRAGSGPRASMSEVATANRCILCNAYGAGQAPHICSSCNNKH